MNLEMQTALLNTYPPKLIAKILKALREQIAEQGGSIEVETLRPQQSTFARNSPETSLHQTTRRGSSEDWRR